MDPAENPYQSPGPRAPLPRFLRVGHRLAVTVLGLLGLGIVADGSAIVALIGRILVIGGAVDGAVAGPALGQTLEVMQWLPVAVLAATPPLYLAWIHTAHRNLGRLGVAVPWNSPTGAVLGYLVPGVNLVMPYVAMRGLHRASDRAGHPGERGREPFWLLLWWGSCLASLVAVVHVTLDEARLADGTLDSIGAAVDRIIALVLIIAAAALTSVAVQQVDDRQRRSLDPVATA